MDYKKIKPKKIYEEVAETIYEMIRNGQLKPGQKLDSVQQLAESFQVGRSAIREALTSLRAMGLVDMRQGEGTFIREFDTDQITFPLSTVILMNQEDIANLLEVRKIIELGTAAAAAKRRTNQHLMAMEKALEEMKAASGNEELGEGADLQFHLAIAEASQNALLLNLMNHVSSMTEEAMKETRKVWLFSKQTTLEKLAEQHDAIYKAIKERNEEQARYFMKIHLENVEAVIQKYYQQSN
ncbi:FadR/GntR family transcriptional regulator [Bacillus sp. EB600]|uniref:FadR/GntR family transcriptional regulator n=1 Tax=Bacillus sp. EB600 TaxID=2806345 RepID=UPI00210E2653|nr:FadR/GntR family transcriptional regulator [Bacillus sp. EB600]MCQ6279860.1 FadR family transcriptional regulator [Bacillus sp. EB600]